MHLVFLIKSLDTNGGGAERVLVDVTRGLAGRGHRVTVVTYDKPGSSTFYPLDPDIQQIGLGIGRPRAGAGFLETALRIRALHQTLRRLSPDVAIAFMHSAYIPLAISLARTGIPVVASEHISWDHYLTRPLQRFLLRISTPLFTRMTIMSARIREGFPPAIRELMVEVPNPVARLGEADRSQTMTGLEAPKRILSVGRLEPQKDHRTLVAAFSQLAPEFPDWTLRIVGEGALRPLLQEQVAALGLEGRVEMPGATQDIAAEYQSAAMFVLPSLYESFGLVTAEALSLGLPAIGFADCAGTNELIRHRENGLLVEGDDRVSALADAMRALIRFPGLRAELAARGPASVEKFASDRVAESWENLLLTVSREGTA